jgi:hypothetical protein
MCNRDEISTNPLFFDRLLANCPTYIYVSNKDAGSGEPPADAQPLELALLQALEGYTDADFAALLDLAARLDLDSPRTDLATIRALLRSRVNPSNQVAKEGA